MIMLTTTELQTQLEEQRDVTGVLGIAMGDLFGRRKGKRGLWETNVNHPLTVTNDTLFQIGSITKIMTETVAMPIPSPSWGARLRSNHF